MEIKKSKKLLAMLALAYWLLVIMIYLVAGQQFRFTAVSSDALSPSSAIGEIVDGMTITQTMTLPADTTTGLEVLTGTYDRANTGALLFTLTDGEGNEIARKRADVSAFEDGKYARIALDAPISLPMGTEVTLHIESEGCAYGNAVTLYSGNTISAGRFDIAQNIKESDRYTLSGQVGVGKLCAKLTGVKALSFYKTYWVIVSAAFLAAVFLCHVWWKEALKGRNNPLVAVCTLYCRYSFLLKQLVMREFNKKYKRSVLGVFWSFLNPLMTMGVQYIVFSTIFRSDIPNYPVYLLTGVVFMNFFTEAVSLGMTSITGNAPLIKKVYMPKYIFPLSRVVSSLINFVIAFIPLMLVMLVTGTAFRPALLLLAFDILCMLGFVGGMVMLLTTAMTFFQDTQFIWKVLNMMWMYLTPVFYPETIIPAEFVTLYHMNPMYQYVTFARICIIDGVSPEPAAYLWCILSSAAVLLIGLVAFKKKQDEFVLHV